MFRLVVQKFFHCINLRAACLIIAGGHLLEALLQCVGFDKVYIACYAGGFSSIGDLKFVTEYAFDLSRHWNVVSLVLLLFNILVNIFLFFGGLCRNVWLCLVWMNSFSVVVVFWELEFIFCMVNSEFCKCLVTHPSTAFTFILILLFTAVLGFFIYFVIVVHSFVYHLQNYTMPYVSNTAEGSRLSMS